VRFSCLGGLLAGLEDLERQRAARRAGHTTDPDGKGGVDEVVTARHHTRGKVEEEVIMALAEVMEDYPLPLSDQLTNGGTSRLEWELEFVQRPSRTTGRSEFIPAVTQTRRTDIHSPQGAVATRIFVLSSQVLPFVTEDRLRALPLEVLFPVLFLCDKR